MVSESLINLCKITPIQSHNPYSISSNLISEDMHLSTTLNFLSIAVIASIVCLSIVVIDFQKFACSHFMRWSPFKCHRMCSCLNPSLFIVYGHDDFICKYCKNLMAPRPGGENLWKQSSFLYAVLIEKHSLQRDV